MKKGITLIELLVAIIISGIVIFITLEMFKGESANYSQTRNRIKLQTDAREAIRIIEEELSNAGFRSGATISSDGILATSSCNNGYTMLNGFSSQSFFKPAEHSIEFKVYNPFENQAFDCTNDLQWIAYRFDPDDSILYRRSEKGDAAAFASAPEVPFLEHIANFEISYGVFRDNEVLLNPALSGTNSIDETSVSTTRNASITSVPWTLTNWSTSTGSAVLKVNLGKLDTNSTYRVKFESYANEDFFDATSGMNLTELKAGFFHGAGTPSVNVFTFKPGTSAGAGSARTIQYDLSPSATGIENDVYFGVTGSLKATSTLSPSMVISGISVTKLNHGMIDADKWIEATNTTQEWSKIGAARITLSVRGKNNTLLTHQRTIQMPNNDPRI